MKNRPHSISFSRAGKNWLEFLLFLLFSGLARLLPRQAALSLGRPFGDLARLLLAKRRNIARQNIQRAFPGMPSGEVDGHVRAVFQHIGIGIMEMLRLDLLSEDRDLPELFRFEGLHHLREAFALQKGVILLTGHIGFWEAGTFFLPKLGFPVDFIAKEMRNPFIDLRLRRMREAGGGRCIRSRYAARKILAALAENRGVATLLDQHIHRGQGVPVDFFGQPAFTTPIIAEIAVRYGIPVVPIFCYRTPENRYQVVLEPMLMLDRSADPADIIAQTHRLVARIEAAVRKDIDQWLWLHRRWRPMPQP